MRKRCKRKVWEKVNPIERAIEKAHIATDESLKPLRMRQLSAIEAFRMGKAGLQDWSDLVNMMNIAEHMAFRGIGEEAKPTCDQAHAHLIEAARRFQATGRMGLTGSGLQCMRDLYQYADLQRKSITRAEYEKHVEDTFNRINGNAPEVVDVMEEA